MLSIPGTQHTHEKNGKNGKRKKKEKELFFSLTTCIDVIYRLLAILFAYEYIRVSRCHTANSDKAFNIVLAAKFMVAAAAAVFFLHGSCNVHDGNNRRFLKWIYTQCFCNLQNWTDAKSFSIYSYTHFMFWSVYI